MKTWFSRALIAVALTSGVGFGATAPAFASGTTVTLHVAQHEKAPKPTLHSANAAFKLKVVRARARYRAEMAAAKTSAQRLAARGAYRHAVAIATTDLEIELEDLGNSNTDVTLPSGDQITLNGDSSGAVQSP